MLSQFYYDWKNNDLEEFYKNYEFDKDFLNEFFKLYHDITYEYLNLKDCDWIKNNIEKKFLKLIIELEDVYNVVKYMKRYKLDYKKILKGVE